MHVGDRNVVKSATESVGEMSEGNFTTLESGYPVLMISNLRVTSM